MDDDEDDDDDDIGFDDDDDDDDDDVEFVGDVEIVDDEVGRGRRLVRSNSKYSISASCSNLNSRVFVRFSYPVRKTIPFYAIPF